MDLHKPYKLNSKYKEVRDLKVKDIEQIIGMDIIKYIHNSYWIKKMSTKDIAQEVCVSEYFIKKLAKEKGVRFRNHAEQLQQLKIMNTGRIWTEEAKHNVSIGVKASYNEDLKKQRTEDNIKYWTTIGAKERKKRYTPGLRKMQLNAQLTNVSSIEIKIKNELDLIGVDYVHQKPICKGKYILDFYLPDYKLVVECNGSYWHKLPDRQARDIALEEYVKSKGRKIVFIWEDEINKNAKEALNNAMKGRERYRFASTR